MTRYDIILHIFIAFYLICFLFVVNVFSQSTNSSLNLTLPSPSQNYQSDKFKAGDLDCSNAIGSATNLEFGVTGIVGKDGGDVRTNDVGLFGRIVIPLGSKVKSRINCNRLYELELIKKQLEVQKLEAEINRLKELQFQN